MNIKAMYIPSSSTIITVAFSGGTIISPGLMVTLVRVKINVSLDSRAMSSSSIGKFTHFKNSEGLKVNSWSNNPSPGCKAGEERNNPLVRGVARISAKGGPDL